MEQPPLTYPPRNKALIRAYSSLASLNKAGYETFMNLRGVRGPGGGLVGQPWIYVFLFKYFLNVLLQKIQNFTHKCTPEQWRSQEKRTEKLRETRGNLWCFFCVCEAPMVVSMPLFTHEFCIILHDHYVWLVKIWCVWLIEMFVFFSILWCFGVFNSHITFSVAIIGPLRRKAAKELGASNKALLQSLLVSQQTIMFVTFFFLSDRWTNPMTRPWCMVYLPTLIPTKIN